MAEIDVQVVHPVSSEMVEVTVDTDVTAREFISQLIHEKFVPANEHGYQLAIKGGATLGNDETLGQAGVQPQTILRVVPATDAGRHVGIEA